MVLTPSYADICVVRAMLESLGLPTELVLEILAMAQYEPVLNFDRSQYVTTQGHYGHGDPLSRVCLIAEILSQEVMHQISSPEVTLEAKEISFNVSSCDQGWTSENTQGTFNTSSWLEVSIIRPDKRTSFQEVEHLVRNTEFGNAQHLHNLLQAAGHKLVDKRPSNIAVGPQGGEPPLAWYLQGNQVAAPGYTDYHVRWASTGFEGNEGAGKGEGFIDALQEGDLILVWARAKVRYVYKIQRTWLTENSTQGGVARSRARKSQCGMDSMSNCDLWWKWRYAQDLSKQLLADLRM